MTESLPDDLFIDEGEVEQHRRSAARPPRRKRGGKPFERTWWECLEDRGWDWEYPPQNRLWKLILRLTGEGDHPAAIGNASTAVIGVSRDQKWRYLRRLEERGRIRVVRADRSAPIVELTHEVKALYQEAV
jgi:hypothetical protein